MSVVFHFALAGSFDRAHAEVEANNRRRSARMERLRQADASLDKVRLYLRLAAGWGWLNQGQYRHASKMVAEMGRLLGGWQKQMRASGV